LLSMSSPPTTITFLLKSRTATKCKIIKIYLRGIEIGLKLTIDNFKWTQVSRRPSIDVEYFLGIPNHSLKITWQHYLILAFGKNLAKNFAIFFQLFPFGFQSANGRCAAEKFFNDALVENSTQMSKLNKNGNEKFTMNETF